MHMSILSPICLWGGVLNVKLTSTRYIAQRNISYQIEKNLESNYTFVNIQYNLTNSFKTHFLYSWGIALYKIKLVQHLMYLSLHLCKYQRMAFLFSLFTQWTNKIQVSKANEHLRAIKSLAVK